MTQKVKANVLGFPRFGAQRELKKAVEAFWKAESNADQLLQIAKELRLRHWTKQQEAGIELIPSNDFSFYDQILDASMMLGIVPKRFQSDLDEENLLDTYFAIARGNKNNVASEMTKWFDTNYHYIVPEFNSATKPRLLCTKVIDQYKEAKAAGIQTKPVLIGPITYLALSKATEEGYDPIKFADQITAIYAEVLMKLEAEGAEYVQIDEAIFSTDMPEDLKALATATFTKLKEAAPKLKLILTNYFGELQDNLDAFFSIPADTYHVDLVFGGAELESVLDKVPPKANLSLGLVNGRNIWKNDYQASKAKIDQAIAKLGTERLLIASSCSLLHSPVSLEFETKLDTELKSWLAFAYEKLDEIADLALLATGDLDEGKLAANTSAIESRKSSNRIHNAAVKDRIANLQEADFNRPANFDERIKEQNTELNLPLYPTTTIGSFPQTEEVRQKRAAFKKGKLSQEEYDAFIAEETTQAIRWQEEIDIDVLVHGEFERNDMVEYFGEQLEGFAFTQNGWVQSYGSRGVKPPIIFGDVSRKEAMTVRWSSFAQKLTERQVKGMLTGPITILQWSFERDDQSKKDTANQIALALRDEVVDLQNADIKVIQIDEPAVREGLPLRKSDWDEYLNWAARAFRLSASGVENSTQIHTHMCYSEFNDIIEAIADLDADVISIETSRSNMELLDAFVNFDYPNQIGPGVYDIHSPRIPQTGEMSRLLNKASDVLKPENIWVNPDCGLKTRAWAEVKPALENMVNSAKELRAQVKAPVAT